MGAKNNIAITGSPVVGPVVHTGPGRRVAMFTLPGLTLLLALLSAGVLATSTLAGCHGAAPLPPAAPHLLLRLAVATSPQAVLLRLAQVRGHFAAEGLDVVVTSATHGKAAIELLDQGLVDVATAADVPFVLSVLAGSRDGLLTELSSTAADNAIVARRDRGIALASDLRGRRVGVTPDTSGHYFLHAVEVRHRLRPGDVVEVPLQPPQMAPALAEGRVDAVATFLPWRQAAQAAVGTGTAVILEPQVAATSFTLVARRDWLATHDDVARRLLRALLRAEAALRADPEGALSDCAAWLHVTPAQLRPTWDDIDQRVQLRQGELVTLETIARWALARRGATAGAAAVPDFLDRLDMAPLLALAPERVSVIH